MTQDAPGDRVGVIGVGYVGLVTAACLAKMGRQVTCRDIDAAKVERLRAGEVPIYEPGLAELLAEPEVAARISFTTDMAETLEASEIVIVAVNTPSTWSGDADLSRVFAVVDELAVGPAPAVVVVKSTVPVGTGDKVRGELDRRGLSDVAYASNPEFLREGSAVRDFLEPDRVVVGSSSPAALERVAALYEPLGRPVMRTDVASAEMIKYASNAFLATKISFINEIANVCEEVGADVSVVSEGMGRDERIGPSFLRPGVGYGGSCFPKDVQALKQLAGNTGYAFQLLTSVVEVNELQKRRVISKFKRHLGTLRGRRIALLGLAFKPETDDMREASSLVLGSRLLAEGARVIAWDPVAMEQTHALLPAAELAASAEEALADADGAVLVTEWRQILDLDWPRLRHTMRTPVLIDGRNALDPARMRAAGYTYESIGRP